ncbi:MAG: hypothetical protein HY782_04045 [Chloroflexi bacterium]|nr:hypothetical protein [Chloroflexota bacterium]
MFGSAVLEVAIGIVFVFLLVSLICSQIGNKISEALKWRADELEKGIRDLVFHGDVTKLGLLYQNPLIEALVPTVPEPSALRQWLGALPILKQLGGLFSSVQVALKQRLGVDLREGKPISIPSRTFVLALFNTFVPGSSGKTTVTDLHDAVARIPDSRLKTSLLALLTAKNDEIDTARKNVEDWFNGAMDRVSESYRRNMWHLALIIGLSVSVVMNVDAIAITSNLWRDPTLRAAVAAAAGEFERSGQPDEAQRVLNQLDLPIGWQMDRIPDAPWLRFTPKDWATPPADFSYLRALLLKLIGWIVTGLAGAQGAPFWFDLLRKLTQRDSAPRAT